MTSTYSKLKDLDEGIYPAGSLMQASDGKFYGMTSQGGSNLGSVIFSYDPLSSIYTNLEDLDDAGGNYPCGSLVQASNGMLYGMTSRGRIL